MTRRGQSPSALRTELDAECDQQLGDGIGQSITFGRMHRRRYVLSTS